MGKSKTPLTTQNRGKKKVIVEASSYFATRTTPGSQVGMKMYSQLRKQNAKLAWHVLDGCMMLASHLMQYIHHTLHLF